MADSRAWHEALQISRNASWRRACADHLVVSAAGGRHGAPCVPPPADIGPSTIPASGTHAQAASCQRLLVLKVADHLWRTEAAGFYRFQNPQLSIGIVSNLILRGSGAEAGRTTDSPFRQRRRLMPEFTNDLRVRKAVSASACAMRPQHRGWISTRRAYLRHFLSLGKVLSPAPRLPP